MTFGSARWVLISLLGLPVAHAATQAELPDPVPLEESEPETPTAFAAGTTDASSVAAPTARADAQAPHAEPIPATATTPATAPVTAPVTADYDPNAFDLALDGYVRAEYATLQNERFLGIKMAGSNGARRNPYVGRNDGFALGSARLNVRASLRQLYVRLGFDGAQVVYSDKDPVVGELRTGLKDAYLRYTVHPHLSIFAGRFKPPFDAEELTPEEDQLFVHRSLESRGVERTEGYASDMPGFAPGRQTGVMAGSSNPAWNYVFALTNGNSGDASVNDNDTPALWLRFTHESGSGARNDEEGPASVTGKSAVVVGVSGYYNTKTFGVIPSRRRDREIGVGIDVNAHVSVFELGGQILAQRTSHLVSGRACLFSGGNGTCIEAPREDAIGGHAQLGVRIPGSAFTPAYRFALYDPRASVRPSLIGNITDATRVMHHTLGVRYRAQDLPMVGWLEYTRSVEQGHRALPNDRIEAALQVTFQ